MRDRQHFLFLNAGHFIDPYATLIFATAAALALTREWGIGYAELAPYATPGFVAFGLFSLPAGWIADRWSRHGMMAVFFVGIGLAAILTSCATSPLQIAIGLFVVGSFAAIYHPVGLAMVMAGGGAKQAASQFPGGAAGKTDGLSSGKSLSSGMALAINGVWGNLGVASAALATGLFIDHGGWRMAFIVPGLISIGCGVVYARLFWPEITSPTGSPQAQRVAKAASAALPAAQRRELLAVTATVLVILTMSGFIFQSTTFALPKLFEETLGGWGTATNVGWLTFVVFAIASIGQLIVGRMLDRVDIKLLFIGVAVMQVLFFALMPGLRSGPALLVSCGFMLGAFGQLPITDFIIGRMARPEVRSSVYGARYVVSCLVFASAIPVIAWIHAGWGFDALFRVLAVVAVAMCGMILLLPGRLPSPDAAKSAVA